MAGHHAPLAQRQRTALTWRGSEVRFLWGAQTDRVMRIADPSTQALSLNWLEHVSDKDEVLGSIPREPTETERLR